MVQLKTPAQIEAMKPAGALVAQTLAAVKDAARPGVSTRELDQIAAAVIADGGGVPAFLNYHPRWAPTPYPGVLCTSVNEKVVHAIPDDLPLQPGDLLSVDCGAFVDSWCADAAFSIIVPGAAEVNVFDQLMIHTAERALAAGIAASVPGAQLGDVGYAIGTICREAGFGLLQDHGGHGVGRSMHEAPHVPNESRPHRGLRLRPGLVIAIEPMLQAGGRDDYVHLADGWGLSTTDGSRAAHVEHTIAITEDGPLILTRQ